MNFNFGGTVCIIDTNEYGLLVQKFGHMAFIVDDDIECLKQVSDLLWAIALKRKVHFYKTPWNFWTIKQYKEWLLNEKKS